MVHDLNPKNPHINGLFLPWGGDPINTQIDINQLAQINILVYTGAHIRMALIAMCRTSFVTTDMLNFSKKKDNTKINMYIKWFPTTGGTCSNIYKKLLQHVPKRGRNNFFSDPMVTNIKKFCAKHHENILGFSNIYPKWAAKYLWTWKAKATCHMIFCDCKSNDKNIYAKFHEKIFNDSQDIKKNT